MKNYQHTYCFKSRRTFSLSALKKKYLNAHLLDYLQKSEKPKCFELRSSICLIKHGRVDLNHILATRGLVLLSSSCYTRKEKAGNLHGVGALQAATWAVSVTHSTPGACLPQPGAESQGPSSVLLWKLGGCGFCYSSHQTQVT